MDTICSSCGFTNPPGMRFCGNCGVRLTESVQARQTPDEIKPDQIGAMMGTDLLKRFHEAGLEAAGQRRNVTVLFVDLSDYTRLSQQLDTEDLYEIIQQVIQVLANEVFKYEGMVDKFTGDGLMALFGAPIAHENNAELAIRAALDMQDDMANLSLKLREQIGGELKIHIGIHSGPVIVGRIGSNLMINYTAIGDTVNLARRLDDATPPGTILVSQEVYRQTNTLFDYEPPLALTLKGVDAPVTSYRVRRLKPVPGRTRGLEGLRAPMVGREQELELLKTSFRKMIIEKQGQFVLVTGEAGIGKSRLIAEMKAEVPKGEVTILEGQSLAYRRMVAYWVFLEAFRELLGILPHMSEGEVRTRVQESVSELMDAQAGEVIPLIEHLLSLNPSDESASKRLYYMDAGQLRQQVFIAARDLLLAAARRKPLMLILEDLHWADKSSLDLLLFLLDSINKAPLMIAAISRTFQSGSLEAISSMANQSLEKHFQHIALKSLSTEQSEQLLSQLLTIKNLHPSLRDHILSRASGIPFFLEEILRMLIDHGDIIEDKGGWTVIREIDSPTAVPNTLEGLILARFDRMEENLRKVLQVASVIGRGFSLALLKEVVTGFTDQELTNILQQLGERDFVYPQHDWPGVDYTFKHAVTSDAIYKTILQRDRARLHGRIGSAIEKIYAHRMEGQEEILARHYSLSPHHERALHYVILAGQRAARNYDNDQARALFEQALALLKKTSPEIDQELQVYIGLGDVLVFVGEYSAAHETYQQALVKLIDQDPKTCSGIKSVLHRKLGTTYERQGEFQWALECLNKAQQALDDASQAMPVERAEIANDIGWLHFRWGNFDEAEKALFAALDQVEGSSRYDVIASIYNRLGGVYYQKDDLDQASNYVRKSLVLREELGETVAVARSYNNLGLLNWKQGDWNAALENMKKSIELNATLGDMEATLHLHLNVGLLQTDRGELEEARQHLEMGLSQARKIGHAFLEGLAEMHLSRWSLASKEWNKSLEHSQRGLAIFTEIKTQENLVDLYASIGEAWLNLRDLDKASEACETAFRLLNESGEAAGPPNLELGRVYRLQGSIALQRGELEPAALYLKKSIEQFVALKNQIETGRTLVYQSILAHSRRDRVGKRVLANEARLIFRQLGAQLDLKNVDQYLVDP